MDMRVRVDAGSSAGRRIAVVGSGIAGLASAWLLAQRHEVHLFEAADRLGGHTNTVDVTLDGITHPVDTGFLVFNERTYPNLLRLFAHLGVASVPSDMSFSVALERPRLEWSGTSVATVFGQPRNLVRPAFWQMLSDLLRFNRESLAWVGANPDDARSLRDFLSEGQYSEAFRDWYLLPMAAAIWSCPPARMLDYPLTTFVRFCDNHGLLQILDRPQWRTVAGGGRAYVRKLASALRHVHLNTPVDALYRSADGVWVHSARGVESFDDVVLACHSDQTLRILGEDATNAERWLLGHIGYQRNRAVLHTDASVLPSRRHLWSAWNYRGGIRPSAEDPSPVSVSYLINRLQPLSFAQPVIVTLNPLHEPAPASVLAEFDYAHPVFDQAALAAVAELKRMQGRDRVWFAGAWTGYGFHEDGLKSALAVAERFGCPAPWQAQAQTTVRTAVAA